MRVLILGRMQSAMDKVLPIVRGAGFDVVGFLTDEEAIENLRSSEPAAVLFGGSVEESSRQRLRLVAGEVGAHVIEVEKGDKQIEHYVRDEVIPRLRALRDMQVGA
jgi:hypothetical protein